MKDGVVVHAKQAHEWQAETLDPSQETVIWKLQKSLCGLRDRETLAGPSGANPQEVRRRPEHA